MSTTDSDSLVPGSTDKETSPGGLVSTRGPDPNPDTGDSVRRELKRILASRYFRTAGRSRQFLEFVVEYRLGDHPEHLKERTIGTQVFQRPADYATGDDPVVRVQAGEVRRRLEQFYHVDEGSSQVRIVLPVGSYCPEFHWKPEIAEPAPAAIQYAQDTKELPAIKKPDWVKRYRKLIGVVVLLPVLLLAIFFAIHQVRQRTMIEEFWAPVFSTPQPVLICLAKGVTYRPSSALYNKYRSTHPGTFESELEKSNDPLPLDPDQTIQWRDMSLFSDYGVAKGDVYAATRISGILGQLGKTTQLRIGPDYAFQDLRNSPSVIIGAFNNKWTMSQMSNLHFAFVEGSEGFVIREQVPNGRTWPSPQDRNAVWTHPQEQGGQSPQILDYAIVGRLMDSKTGQFTVVAAGLTGAGTQAAGEFISTPAPMDRALRDAPPNWKKSNSLFVLKTTVTDAVAGPPTVVASYYW